MSIGGDADKVTRIAEPPELLWAQDQMLSMESRVLAAADAGRWELRINVPESLNYRLAFKALADLLKKEDLGLRRQTRLRSVVVTWGIAKTP